MKVTKEMFWKLPQLSRIEYILVRKELRDRSNFGVTFTLIKYLIFITGFMMLVSLIGYLIDPDLFVSFMLLTRRVVGMFGIAIGIGIALDILFIFMDFKKVNEINERFFNDKRRK